MLSQGARSSPNWERACRPSPCSPSGWCDLAHPVQVEQVEPRDRNSQNTTSRRSVPAAGATPSRSDERARRTRAVRSSGVADQHDVANSVEPGPAPAGCPSGFSRRGSVRPTAFSACRALRSRSAMRPSILPPTRGMPTCISMATVSVVVPPASRSRIVRSSARACRGSRPRPCRSPCRTSARSGRG